MKVIDKSLDGLIKLVQVLPRNIESKKGRLRHDARVQGSIVNCKYMDYQVLKKLRKSKKPHYSIKRLSTEDFF